MGKEKEGQKKHNRSREEETEETRREHKIMQKGS